MCIPTTRERIFNGTGLALLNNVGDEEP